MKQETIFAQHQQWCVHYRAPFHNKTCEAGVSYDEQMRTKELGRTGCMLRLPCVRSHHEESERRGEPLFECPKLQWPTIEESAAHEAETRRHMDKMMMVSGILSPLRKQHAGKNWAGVIECPACKGRLHVRHHGYNNHVHVNCETHDCVSWIE